MPPAGENKQEPKLVRKPTSSTGAEFKQHNGSSPTAAAGADQQAQQQHVAVIDDDERGYWGHKAEFILSCIGLSVGIGNVWRFPYMAYDNGGGAFLIPYLIMLALIGKPLYYLELAVGQYARVGPSKLFGRMSPITAGIGYAMVYSCCLICVYYNVIMSYAAYFTVATVASIGGALPWQQCSPAWADMSTCWVRRAGGENGSQQNSSSALLTASNLTVSHNSILNATATRTGNISQHQSSTDQYFYRQVLKKFDFDTNEQYSIAKIGGIVPELVGCLAFCWIVTYFCIMRGIKSSGKAAYFTATFPYVLLLILLVRGLFLEGAWTGISYFITPTWDKLFRIATWRAAATQMFYSLATSAGCLIMFGSYNRFGNNCHFDAVLVSSLDTVTSLIAGFVVFAQLGNLAVQVGLPVAEVAEGGPGLAFVVYPEAISKLPWPHLWGICFFAMLFILGLDSQFAVIETVISAIDDHVPKLRKRRLWVTLAVCVLGFVCALPCVCRGGLDVVGLFELYGGSFSFMFIAVYELLAVGWFYGVDRFAADLQLMHGLRPGLYWRICWRYIAPLILTIILIATFADFEPLSASVSYPAWADGIGWAMALVAILTPPLVAVYAWARADGHTLGEKFRRARSPRKSWGPADAHARHTLQQQSYVNPTVSWSRTSIVIEKQVES